MTNILTTHNARTLRKGDLIRFDAMLCVVRRSFSKTTRRITLLLPNDKEVRVHWNLLAKRTRLLDAARAQYRQAMKGVRETPEHIFIRGGR